MPSLYLSAAHKSSGKTTVAIGLNAAFRARGLTVQPFKKGPDYIDPIWLGLAAGKPCYSLDFFNTNKDETIADFQMRSASAELSIIEGNKGLYDGLDLDGSNSNAALAKALGTPVILVIDVRGTMRGIAPLLLGYQAFDPGVKIAGVIANLCGGQRHESKLRAAVKHYTDIPFLGALDRDPALALAEQHLGLIPGHEDDASLDKIAGIRNAVSEQLDLQQIFDISEGAKQPPLPTIPFPLSSNLRFPGLRIGIARDRAFGFYYPADLEAFQQYGAELVPIDTLSDKKLPEIDGLFIGGGFPERHAAALQANSSLRDAIKNAIEQGLPAYAECGGLMYLSQRLSWHDQTWDMVGAIPGNAVMHDKPCGRGYVKLNENQSVFPWPKTHVSTSTIHAHEFHYSSIEGLLDTQPFAYEVLRGSGITQNSDGLVYKNLLASYAHLRNTRDTPWVGRFLSFVERTKTSNQTHYSKAL